MQTSKENRRGYNTAFKSTALFGGVQMVVILISIIKSKLISLWLGKEGYGIMALFNAAINLISSVTNLGIQSSAVRDIAEAEGKNDGKRTSQTVKAIWRWIWMTGLLGAVVTVILSPWLSRLLFKSNDYIVSIVFLSVVVLLTGLYNGHYALLQGTRHLKLLALANVYGALAAFACSIPIFYILRQEGIVLALIITAAATLAVSWSYAKKVKLLQVEQTWRKSLRIGAKTAKLGISMAISGIAVLLVQFVVKAFVNNLSGEGEVGLYQAGWAINATYLGMVFTAMAKDYFPRLSQHASDSSITKQMVDQQGEIALLLLAPLIIIMLVFSPLLIHLLYTSEFDGAVLMTKWLLIGSLIKSGSWGISFVFLAKGDGRLFLFNELGIKCITLPLYLLGYYLFGLVGIGYAFALNYVFYFIWVGVAAYVKYRLIYGKVFWKLFIILLVALLAFPIGEEVWNAGWITGIVLICFVTIYSLYELNRRISIKGWIDIIKSKYGRK